MKSWVEKMLAAVASRTEIPFAIRYRDGTESRSRDATPAFTLVFRSPRAYWRIAAFGHVGLLEAYFADELDIEGSLPKALAAGMEGGIDSGEGLLVWLRNRWHELSHSNAVRSRARSNAEAHYALPPEFYKFWLDDPLMLYTCAYWAEDTRSLEEAQRNKCDHVARKLLLKPGEEVIDVGSGFGGFMFHANERYGVKVTAVNTTGSQAEHARREIERRRLGNALSMQMHEDFRDAGARQFDKVVSIGCLEHAGRDQLTELIRAHARYLKQGGIGLIHFIGHVGRFDTDFFIRKYVFPGGWIPSLADVIVEMEKAGLEILDIENLRRHYALTLDVWAERFDRSWHAIRALDPKRFDERFRRIWRVYLYGCAEMFRAPNGRTHLFQVVYSKGNVTRSSYPMTREFLYEQLKASAPRRVGHG
ncbi:MAG TPA: cyclopropane-fatty-acyl-phospholipid synthase family protein [Burkholderiales bacterium]|nr:cyclopropane-fatty-acyl-phospholipid synthase family protein [Burkholderiales bacterium]